MPIISRIGRRYPGVRALIALIYLLLVAGSITMVYPFLLMLSGSTKSAVDSKAFEVVPRFLIDDAVLYRKHVEGLFNERLDDMRIAYNLQTRSFENLALPGRAPPGLVDAWLALTEEGSLPAYSYALGYIKARVSKTEPRMLRAFKLDMLRRFQGHIELLNRELGTDFPGWNAFNVSPENYLPRHGRLPGQHDLTWELTRFKAQQPRADCYYFMAEGYFRQVYLPAQYTRDVGAYNRAHGTAIASYSDVLFPDRAPPQSTRERVDWEDFVRTTLGLLWIRVDPEAVGVYHRFLAAKYGNLETLNRNYGEQYADFDAVPLPADPPLAGLRRSDWSAFISGWKDPETGKVYVAPADHLRVESVESLFRAYLKERFGTLEALNGRLGTRYDSFAAISPPQQATHYRAFLQNKGAIRWEFVSRNYRTVVDYMVLHGRGVLNTCIYCILAVLAALIVNPMAAYALSRYRPPSTYKLLLVMLITMAFPPMVTQIPVFLMLREFRLLNTFAALVLPGLAHGYSIFLLKGFFDSLPRELYECAQIDGAREWTMFWQITMSLSKPILAVIALHAFTAAYANFMFALLICQDERMWTLMVWLYQLQQRSGPGVVYASLIIAAVPTFLVFAFCQNVIMRGIVVPVEK